jgi:DNA-3-methyladenine glycosylase
LFGEPGRAFIYMVHSYWLLNFVAHPAGEVGGVLIRAVEPLEGIWIMKKNRGLDEVRELTSGPGKLTRAMSITKDFNGKDITSTTSCLGVVEGTEGSFKIDSSNRIGVKVDLLQKLRFFIKENRFVSR